MPAVLIRPRCFCRPVQRVFRHAYESPTHAHFCEAVYGYDLIPHGMIDVQVMVSVASLLKPGEKVLEISCSMAVSPNICPQKPVVRLWGDYSDAAITQAQHLTRPKGQADLSMCGFDCRRQSRRKVRHHRRRGLHLFHAPLSS